MGKTWKVLSLVVVCCAVPILGSVPIAAQPFDVMVNVTEAPPGTWKIQVVDPKGPDICRTMDLPVCDGQSFRWKVTGKPLSEAQKVVVEAAAIAPDCFGGATSWEITGSGSADSPIPSPSASCPLDNSAYSKYGILWPYDVVLYQRENPEAEWVEVARSDPRGIVH